MKKSKLLDFFQVGICGPTKTLEELEAERVQCKAGMTSEQITEIELRMSTDCAINDLAKICATSISNSEMALCALFAVIIASLARLIDSHGKDFESAINRMEIKHPATNHLIKIGTLDTCNPFDAKKGKNHRIAIGHDLNFWAKLPADYLLREGVSVEELLGGGKPDYALYELILQKYGIKGNLLSQCLSVLKVTGIHYLKDIVTISGLPLPFSSIFTEFTDNAAKTCGYSTKNLLYDGFAKELDSKLHMLCIRASDLTSLASVDVLCGVYCKHVRNDLDCGQRESLRKKMSVATSGFLLLVQVLLLCTANAGTSFVSGAKLNILVAAKMVDESVAVCREAFNNQKLIMNAYDRKRAIITEVCRSELP